MIRPQVLLLSMALLLYSCQSKPETTQPAIENITASVYASGIVKSRNQYQVFPSASGLVAQLLVTEGDTVHKGDALILITNTRAVLNTENAALSASYAAEAANQEKLRESQNDIYQATIQMDNAALLLTKQQHLWAQQIGNRNELDLRELNYKNAASTRASAQLRYTQLQKQIQFQEKQARKNIQIASADAANYSIRSIIDGSVFSLLVKAGETVNPQTAVALLGDAHVFELELQVDEYDIARVKTGQPIILSMDSYKGQVFEAKVEKIEPLMNERSKSFTVKASFTRQPALLYPSLSCEANIVIQQKQKALTIPRSYLVNDSIVQMADRRMQKVVVGLKDYEKVEITAGLSATDIIFKPTQ
jgi:HlyD family secretion protein